jgi:hypothetical protein
MRGEESHTVMVKNPSADVVLVLLRDASRAPGREGRFTMAESGGVRRRRWLDILGVVLMGIAALAVMPVVVYFALRHGTAYFGPVPSATFFIVPFVAGGWCVVLSPRPSVLRGWRAWVLAVGTILVIGGLIGMALIR